jgi:hypothetical protein
MVVSTPEPARRSIRAVSRSRRSPRSRWKEQSSELVQHLADELWHLCLSRKVLVVGPPLTQADDLGNVGVVSQEGSPLISVRLAAMARARQPTSGRLAETCPVMDLVGASC